VPLKPGKSDKVISQNISELMAAYKRKGKIGHSRPKSKAAALNQAIAIAMKKAGKNKNH